MLTVFRKTPLNFPIPAGFKGKRNFPNLVGNRMRYLTKIVDINDFVENNFSALFFVIFQKNRYFWDYYSQIQMLKLSICLKKCRKIIFFKIINIDYFGTNSMIRSASRPNLVKSRQELAKRKEWNPSATRSGIQCFINFTDLRFEAKM